MRLLTEVAEIEEYYRLRTLMEGKGIALHVANEDTARNFGVFHPVGKYAIHVLFEEQLEDARALLLNENHQVKNAMDVANFQQYIDDSQQDLRVRLLKLLSMSLVVVLTAIVLMLSLIHI